MTQSLLLPRADEVEPTRGRHLTGVEFLLPLFSVVILLVVPAALFVAPVLAGPVSFGVPAALFAVSVVYCAVRLGSLMWEAEPRWSVLGLWMFSYAWFAVSGLTQTLADRNPLGFTLPQSLATEQAALVLAGLLCFDVASRVRPRNPGSALPAALGRRVRGRVLSPGRVLLLGVGTLVTAPAFIALLGGPRVLLSDRQSVYEQLSASGLYSSASNATGGLVSVIGGVLPFVALICLAKLLADDPVFRRRTEVWLLGTALVGLNVLMNNPISNARYWAFAIVLAFFFTWRGSTRPAVITTFVTIFALSALIVFPYLDAFRVSASTAKTIRTPSYSQPVDYVLGKTDYASITDIAVSIRVADHLGHSYGRQLLGAATFWVPRSIWPGKPDNTAFLIADEIAFPNRNLDSPLWAEGYVDFGWVGACGLLALFGLGARRLDDAFVALRGVRTRAVPLVAVAVPVLAGYEYILIRGSLLQAMARIVTILVLLAAVSHVPRRAGPPEELPAEPPVGLRAVRPEPAGSLS